MKLQDLFNDITVLHRNGVLIDTDIELLSCIIHLPQYDADLHNEYIKLGFNAALRMYDTITMNREYEQTSTDPANPRNWEGYQRYLELTEQPSE